MTMASDQLKSEKVLSQLGKSIVHNRDEILKRWETIVRQKMITAKELPLPILMDTLPAFIDNIAEAVSQDHPRSSADQYNTIANEHGGERARLTNYSHEHLIEEYQILRWVFIKTLTETGIKIETEEMSIINASIDTAIQAAAASFSLVQSDLREQYIATLSHDMKTPLSTVFMSAERILKKPSDPEQVIKQAQKIKANANRINRMIEDLLDITVLGTTGHLDLNPEEFELKALIQQIIDNLPEQQSRIKIIGNPMKGYWDKSYLGRAIENLINNALKYGEENTLITIKIDEKFERMFFNIHNLGEPIPVEDRECIFQVFRRAAAAKAGNRKGWGLGLPLVRAVSEAHGGSIILDSSVETGTTFVIDIPKDSRPFINSPVSRPVQ